ncbi:hypothetical protein [Natronorarus salvus]|uniref:hypothetical protein n=1 Tax=Natronorarus salvus TaxID=3117733 RepID=UPI002F2612A5
MERSLDDVASALGAMAVGVLALGQYDAVPIAALAGMLALLLLALATVEFYRGKRLETVGAAALAVGCGSLAAGVDGGVATAPLLVLFGVGLWALLVGRFFDRLFEGPRSA